MAITATSLRGKTRSARDALSVVSVSLEYFRRQQPDPTLPAEVPESPGQPFRMNLLPLDNRDGEKLVFPYNPEEYSTEQPVNWQPHGANGAVNDRIRWQGNGPKKTQWELLLDDYHWPDGNRTGSENGTRLEDLLRQLELWHTQPSIVTQEPPLLFLQFGSKIFLGNITSLRSRKLRLNPQGDALAASVAMEFTENDSDN